MLSSVPRTISKPENAEEEEVFEKPFRKIDTVTIVSSDNQYYVIPKSTAEICKIFSSAFRPGSSFQESITKEIHLDYNSKICEEIIRFLFHKQQGYPPEKFNVPDELVLDLYAVSDFLGI